MTKDQEQKLQAMIAENIGTPGTGYPCEAAASLRDRIRDQQSHAQQEARRADQLAELSFLLEKHPEIARMLDLLDAVRR